MSFGAIKFTPQTRPVADAPAGPTAGRPSEISARQTADLELLARWMDSAWAIPGVPVRFGFDSVLGLIPGVGDAAGSFVSLYILHKAHRLGLPRTTIVRMALNVAADLIVGVVPLAGDVFDVYWKANRRNVDLVRRHIAAEPAVAKSLRRGDRVVVGLATVGIIGLVVASAVVAIYAVGWAWGMFRAVVG